MKALLIISNDAKLRESLPEVLRRTGVEAEATSRVSEALLRIASTPYDAVACTVESLDELACLVRVKKANPTIPVVVLARRDDPQLGVLGEYMGANLVLPRRTELEATASQLVRALETQELIRTTNAYVIKARELIRDFHRLQRETRELVGTAVGLAAASDQRPFYTLLVEDDLAAAALLTRTLAKSGVPPFVRTATSAEEAIAYLSGEGAFGDRVRYPLPSLIISDLKLPDRSGLDLLRWVRNESSVRHVGFIMHTKSDRPKDIEEAYAGGTNVYLVKTAQLAEVADLVKTIYTKCMVFKTGLGY